MTPILPPCSFDDCLYDGQPHASALHPVTLILAAIELVKDQALLHVVNAGTLVGDAEFEVGVLPDFFISAVMRIGDSGGEYLAAFSNN